MRFTYTATPLTDDSVLGDIRISINGKMWHLWGREGRKRELELADAVPPGSLPVLIGSGLGHCMKALLERGMSVVVVDRETPLLNLTGVRKDLEENPNVQWIDDPDPEAAFSQLRQWAASREETSLHPVVMPLYLRLDRAYYSTLLHSVKSTGGPDFWLRARYPKFQTTTPRILFFNSKYFLCDEILSGLKQLGVPFYSLQLEDMVTGSNAFIETLLKTVVDFRPDFALTVNHLGLDREGKLAGLLDELKLPLASWFVDNPHLILFDYARPGADNTVLFTFDASNMDQLHAKGFPNVHHLPLATDPKRFGMGVTGQSSSRWTADISFVGNSMATPVAKSLALTGLHPWVVDGYEDVARQFGQSEENRVDRFLERNRPDWHSALTALQQREERLACETLLTWEATRQYRLACVRCTLPFSPLIVGDRGWHSLLPDDGNWQYLPPLNYYDDLPRFYPLSKINFNCTSRQMPGAVNQRVFDVPACGGFLLTDHREQLETLFDPETETAIYHDLEEIPELTGHFLRDAGQRELITRNARKRILAEHTYEHRLMHLMDIMRSTYG